MQAGNPGTGMEERRRTEIQYISAVVLYGTIGAILRYIRLPSAAVALCRGVIGTLFIMAFLKLKGKTPDRAAIRKNFRWLLMSGIALGLNWIFLFAAYMHTSVAVASLCNYLAPAIAVLLSPFLFGERMTAAKGACVLASFVGIVLISGVLTTAPGDLNGFGILLGLLAAAAFVIIIVCNTRVEGIGSFDKALTQLALAAATILPYVLFTNPGGIAVPDGRSILLVLLLGVVHTGFAYLLYFSGMGVLPTNIMAVLGYLEPAVSVLCSVFFLREPLGVAGWIGAALIIGAAVCSEFV